jgi:hypothetical protein
MTISVQKHYIIRKYFSLGDALMFKKMVYLGFVYSAVKKILRRKGQSTSGNANVKKSGVVSRRYQRRNA